MLVAADWQGRAAQAEAALRSGIWRPYWPARTSVMLSLLRLIPPPFTPVFGDKSFAGNFFLPAIDPPNLDGFAATPSYKRRPIARLR